MNNNPLKYIVLFVFCVLVQVLFLNKIQFSGLVNPYIYLLFIMLLPINTPRYVLLLLGFLLGITIDMFSNTMGMHASATVLIAFIRPFIIGNNSNTDDAEKAMSPTLMNNSFMWFLKYAAIMVIFHHVFLFFVEAFSFSNFLDTVTRSMLSAIFSLTIIIISQLIVFRK